MSVESKKLAIYKKDERKIKWKTVVAIGMIHVVALFAFREDLFSYSGLAVGIFMYFIAGMFGVTICYHRLLTHRSFRTYKWMEYFLTFCGDLFGNVFVTFRYIRYIRYLLLFYHCCLIILINCYTFKLRY